ncbi:hypothetical protein [Prosthecobacter sp.]|uniref:hypothetical protein n=1 Tax=Prosthecobacter sp. TaxID=1965333 RepID=UPI003783B902
MSAPYQIEPVLEEIISSHLNIEAYAFDELAEWCRDSWETSQLLQKFKKQLQSAICKSGSITPKIYRSWTGDDNLETQEAVDSRLKDLWNACFPGERMR